MIQFLIINRDFDTALQITDLLQRRYCDVRCAETAPDDKAHCLIVSKAHQDALGGPKALVEVARKHGSQKLVVVDEASQSYRVQPEMGGRVLNISLPKVRGPVTQHGALLALVDEISHESAMMIAMDPQTTQLIDMARRVARTDVTVFINGPTGSGKEVMARLVHMNSKRADKPFVAINCAAIPENMLEAILFGHEKGSFTGAATANKGIVRAADGGTLFLDEVTEMPLGLQSKLLRVLQEKTVTPLGSQKEEKVDIRVIATSNRDMIDAVRAGTFREDLYYRLNVFPLTTQALCDRPQDIPALAVGMVRRHTPAGQETPTLNAAALRALSDYAWPGNVRELENIIQRALVMKNGPEITENDIMIFAVPSAAALVSRSTMSHVAA